MNQTPQRNQLNTSTREADVLNRATPQRLNQSLLRDQLNISNDLNNTTLINNLYKKYVKAPKGLEEGIGEVDLEIMLVNSLKINASKIQEIIDGFLIDKTYISIFCLPETKVDCVNFTPVRLVTFDKQRVTKPGTLKGGGLMLGYIENEE